MLLQNWSDAPWGKTLGLNTKNRDANKVDRISILRGLMLALPGTQPVPRSSLLMLRVRAEQLVSPHDLTNDSQRFSSDAHSLLLVLIHAPSFRRRSVARALRAQFL